jgi:tetratricopeptide (TPR) repeat protein
MSRSVVGIHIFHPFGESNRVNEKTSRGVLNLVQQLASRFDGRRVAALRTRAVQRTQDRHWADAERAWREVLSVAPNNLDNALELAEVLRRLARCGEADQLLAPFVRNTPADPRVLVVHARIAIAAGDYGGAVQRWQAVLALQPDNFEAHLRLAGAYEKLGDYEKTSIHFERAHELSPDHAELVKPLAAHLKRKGRMRDAAAVYAQVLEQYPRDTDQVLAYTKVLIDLGEAVSAQGVLSRRNQIKVPDGRLLEARIRCDVALGAWPAVIENLHRWIPKAKQSKDAAHRIWDVLRDVGSLEKIPAAQASELADIIAPHQIWLIAEMRRDHAFGFALELLGLFAESSRGMLLRAELLCDLRRYAEAESICQKLLESRSKPRFMQTLQLLDRILVDQLDWLGALAVRRRMAEAAPGASGHVCSIGEALAQLSDLAGAENAYLRAIQLDAGSSEALYRLGLLSFSRNEPRIAQSYLRYASASAPTRADVRYHLGVVSQAMDDRQASFDAYAACLRVTPTHKDALYALIDIEGRDNEGTLWQGHLARIEERSQKSAEEWVFLASARIFLYQFDEAIALLSRAGEVLGYHDEIWLLHAHALRLAGRLDQAEQVIRGLLLKAPFYYRAYDEFLQILCARGMFAEAKAFVTARHLYFDSPELKRRAIGLMTHVHFGLKDSKAALLTYRDCTLARDVETFVGEQRFARSLSDVEPSSRVVALAAWGLGDELLWSSFYPALAARFKRLEITCDPRLAKLFRRSFPNIDFRPTARWMALDPLHGQGVARKYAGLPHLGLAKVVDNAGWDAVLGADKVALVTSVLPDLCGSLDRVPQSAGHLKPDPNRVEFWRDKLAARGGGPKVGIAWSSLRLTHLRRGHLTNLSDWAPVLTVQGVTVVCLDPAAAETDMEEVRQRFAVDIYKPEGLDLRRDIDEKAALMKALDLVICVANGVSELAGAIGAQTWMLNRSHTLDWRVVDSLGTDIFHSSKKHIFVDARHSVDVLMEETAGRLRHWLAGRQPGISS